ncbi:hypothetical protein [Lysobacter capsici]|uniref:hypothetical protein n=1 Tax=Lysobacter capsici TaxID=435897 RepID=UPI001C006132|nr:hypothetical protein [Lysobacter capsici]QWF15595.1 hypothetical protein KME82_17640 [Lysobacter capsici]
MTDDERRKLLNLGGARDARFDRPMLANWLTTASIASLALLFIAASWPLVLRAGLSDPDWGAGWLPYAIVACPLLGAAYASYRTLMYRREVRANRPRMFGSYWADADAGTIQEERYEFLDGRCVHEPEIGGHVHLLRVDRDRCLVIFDLRSFDLAEAGRDPMASAMQPARCAVLRRAPVSGLLMSIEFSGPVFAKTPSRALGHEMPRWADHGKIWRVAWDVIERRLEAV